MSMALVLSLVACALCICDWIELLCLLPVVSSTFCPYFIPPCPPTTMCSRRFAAAGPRNRDRGGKLYRLLRQYSVLLQYSQERKGVVELYRCASVFVRKGVLEREFERSVRCRNNGSLFVVQACILNHTLNL